MLRSAPLTFELYPMPEGTSLAAHIGQDQDRCGVYVLTFEDGSQYIGQSVDVVARCATHVRHAGRAAGERIIMVGFTPVPEAQLRQKEREVIAWCELHGIRLLNKLRPG